jgi:hypothetical protein
MDKRWRVFYREQRTAPPNYTDDTGGLLTNADVLGTSSGNLRSGKLEQGTRTSRAPISDLCPLIFCFVFLFLVLFVIRPEEYDYD